MSGGSWNAEAPQARGYTPYGALVPLQMAGLIGRLGGANRSRCGAKRSATSYESCSAIAHEISNNRSCEAIFEAFKPIEEKYGVMLTITGDIVLIGERYYIKAMARLYDAESDSAPIEVSAWAREPVQKKGMDESQITGAASTYARKYALSGLFQSAE